MMTPEQVAELRADLARTTDNLLPLILSRLQTNPLIRATLRALGLDLAGLVTPLPMIEQLPDQALRVLADLVQRRLTELGAGGSAPTEDERTAAVLALVGLPAEYAGGR